MGPWSIRKIPDRGVPRAAQRLGPESRSGPWRCGLLCDGNREGTREAGLPSPRPAASARKRSPPQISRTCAIRSCITACLSAYQSTGGPRLFIPAGSAQDAGLVPRARGPAAPKDAPVSGGPEPIRSGDRSVLGLWGGRFRPRGSGQRFFELEEASRPIKHVVRPAADRAAMRGPERGGGIER